MRSAIWTADGDIEIVDEATPAPGPGEAVVAMRSVGICGSDLHRYHRTDPAPVGRPGHEMGGVVSAVGAGVTHVREGDVVGVEPIVRCGACDRCREGWYFHCRKTPFNLLGERLPGGLTEYLLAPGDTLHPAPMGIDAEAAALAEPVACTVNAIDVVALQPGETVLVLGAGTIGLTSILALRSAGAQVLITARYPHQGAAALRLGATEVISDDAAGVARLKALRADEAIDVVVETVGGSADTVATAIKTVRPRGRVVMMGIFTTPRISLGWMDLLHEVGLFGSVVYGTPPGQRAHYAVALDVVAAFREETRSLVTHRFPIEQSAAAFATAADKATESVKVHVNPTLG